MVRRDACSGRGLLVARHDCYVEGRVPADAAISARCVAERKGGAVDAPVRGGQAGCVSVAGRGRA